MGKINFWKGNNPMTAMTTLKKTYKLLVGNTDNDEVESLTVEEFLKAFTTDDLASGLTTKQFTDALKAKVDNLPENTLTEIAGLVTAISNAQTNSESNSNNYTDSAIAALKGSAPDAFDTLQEIAAWLQNEDTEDGLTEAALLVAIAEKYSQADADAKNAEIDAETLKKQTILINGSDAYAHADRVYPDKTIDLKGLDSLIEDNLRTPFLFEPFSAGVGRLGVAIPDTANADMGFVRNSKAWFINKHGNLEEADVNVPRFDYSSGKKSLLLEPVDSEQLFRNSGWKGGGTAPSYWGTPATGETTPVNSIFGDLVTAYKFDTGSSDSRPNFQYSNLSVSNGSTYSLSVFVEDVNGDSKISISAILIAFISKQNTKYFENGVEVLGSYSVSAGNYYEMTFEATETAINGFVRIGLGVGFDFPANNYAVMSLPQFEESSNRTSFILSPIGTTQARAAETGVATGDISGRINYVEGVFETEFSFKNNSSSSGKMSLNDNTNANRIEHVSSTTEGNFQIYFETSNDGTIFNVQIPVGDRTKTVNLKTAYKSENTKVKLNNVLVYANKNPFTLGGLIGIKASNPVGNGDFVNGSIETLAVKPIETFNSTATTWEEAIELTGYKTL